MTARFKAVWSPVEGDDTQMLIHILIVSQGHVKWDSRQNNWRNNIRVRVETSDGTQTFATGSRAMSGGTAGSNIFDNPGGEFTGTVTGGGNSTCVLNAVDDIKNSGTATYEFQYQMKKDTSIKLDVMACAVSENGGNIMASYSWAGTNCNTDAAKGVGMIVDQNYLYGIDIVKTTEEFTIDGKADETAWEMAEWSDKFVKTSTDDVSSNGLTARFKAVWSPVEGDDTQMLIHILIVSQGHVKWDSRQNNWRNNIRVRVETSDGTQTFATGSRAMSGGTAGSNIFDNPGGEFTGTVTGGGNSTCVLNAVDDIKNSGTATYEFQYQMKKDTSIKLDVMACAVSENGGNIMASYSWAGTNCNTDAAKGVGNIVETTSEDVEVTMTTGASVRVDTATPELSGIRFASSINVDIYSRLVAQGAKITTGTLIVPTNTLTLKKIADADFTKETLLANDLVEDTHFYDIVNVDNEWVDGLPGTWYATIYDIQDFTRRFSAVGYMTIEVDGEVTTIYGEYQSSNSRSIAQVAKTLMEKETVAGNNGVDGGDWTVAQENILTGFFTSEVQL